jgi:hypothetical protein
VKNVNIHDVLEEVLPYISDPSVVKDFLDNNKDKDITGLINEINKIIPESEGAFKTDLRILLNALEKIV